MSGPRVSIVVPVFNGEQYLAEALDSVLQQTYPNLEIIAVDDGSTDRTNSILAGYSGFVRVLSQQNRGQSASLNRAWREAEGSVLGYLSSDDRLEPGAVDELVNSLMASPQCVMVYPDYWLIDSRGRNLKRVHAPDFNLADALIDCVCPTGPGALFRSSVLTQVGGWDEGLRQIPDWEFILRAGLCGDIRRHPVPLAFFRVHEGSQTFAAPSEERIAEYEFALNTFYSQHGLADALTRQRPRAFANAMVLAARLHLLARSPLRALRCLRRATSHWPLWPTRYRNIKLLLNGLLGLPHMRAWNAIRGWLWRMRHGA
jgi:glycosyltransferase involved in cell wall biosynthesis